MKAFREKHEILYTVCTAVFVMMFCLFFSVWIQGITWDIFSVPLAFGAGSDDMLLFVWVKNFLETGSIVKTTRLGAPFEADFFDFPVVFAGWFDYFVIWLFAYIFSANAFVATSLYYVGLPMLIGLNAFLSLRAMGIVRWISAGGAIVFAFLLFYFSRGIAHFGLATYEFVPLAFLLCVWGYHNDIFCPLTRGAFLKNRRNWLALIICILIANNGNGYWAAFSCFFILLTAVFVVWDTHKRLAALPCLVALGLIVSFFLISISPSILYHMEHGKNPIVGQRVPMEAEIYGLKITQMVVPYEIPGDTGWERKAKAYHDSAPLANENRTAYLGLIGTIGFFALLIRIFHLPMADKPEIIILFARLNLAGTLLALIGGLSTVLAILQGEGIMLRAYNRISVFLAFLAIGAVCWYIDKQWRKAIGKRRHAVAIGAGILFILHFVLLYPWVHHGTDFHRLKTIYQNNQRFFAEMEATLPAGAMVYQMPYHQFPEMGPVNRMGDYQLFTGFLYSETLRWSYGGMKGRKGDVWHAQVNALPLEERLKVLSFVGFSGVYVDRRAYTAEECEKLERELVKRLQVEPVESIDRQIVFYSMLPYNNIFLADYTEEEQEKTRNDLLRICQITKNTGIYPMEHDDAGHRWQWMDRVAEWELFNEDDEYMREVTLTVAAGAVPSAYLIATINGESYTYEIRQEGTKIVIPVKFMSGKNLIRLETDAPRVYAPQDSRSIYMQIVGGSVNFLPSLGSYSES